MIDAYICDIDGTIAEKGDRGIYEFQKCGLDKPIMPVIRAIDALIKVREGDESWEIPTILFVSGRSDICRKETIDWLSRWTNSDVYRDFGDDKLFMREEGDYRPDTIIKQEIYENHIKDKYNILAVFDDRPVVIRMWRELGLFVFNCSQHEREF